MKVQKLDVIQEQLTVTFTKQKYMKNYSQDTLKLKGYSEVYLIVTLHYFGCITVDSE